MAITQDRMIALIDAAQDMCNKLQFLRRAVAAAFAAEDINSALASLEREYNSACPIIEHVQCIATERAHFKRAMHKNNRDAARQRLVRGTPSPGDYSYTSSIRATPARAAGPAAQARANADASARAMSDEEIDAAYRRAYRPEDIARAVEAAAAAPSAMPAAPLTLPVPIITDDCGQTYDAGGADPEEGPDDLSIPR